MIDEIKILNKAKFIALSNVKYFFFVKYPNSIVKPGGDSSSYRYYNKTEIREKINTNKNIYCY